MIVQQHIDSRLAQLGSTHDARTGAVSTPIYQATAFRHPALGQSTGFDYARTKSPTRTVLETECAHIEGGDGCSAFSSGMAAVHAVLSLLRPNEHIIVSMDLYGGTYRLLEHVMRPLGIRASYVDTNDIDAIRQQYVAGMTRMVLIETPSNPLMMITDIARVGAWARAHDVLCVVDNTLMTPYLQRPLALGADIVIHSATKYLAGHNDVLAGLVIARGEALCARIAFIQNAVGAVLAPLDSWLLLRGMKTLALRMQRHEHNATRVAEWLSTHPLVKTVLYPGLPSHPQYALQAQQAHGNTGIFSFRVRDAALVAPLLAHISLIAFAESLGGVESLMTYPAVQTHADIPADVRARIGVDDTLLRLSCGIEHSDDLIADLAYALDAAARSV
ncbi:MAG: PLP-dependent transferase [Paenibacillaceae bacterium]|nr:PLP-dependent transferase [Paenibacillaceae bacterium]